jgi:hypothetical protein
MAQKKTTEFSFNGFLISKLFFVSTNLKQIGKLDF